MQEKFTILDYRSVKPECWEGYVFNHKEGNVFQTYAYLQLHQDVRNTFPFGFALINNESIVGVVAGVIYQNYFFPVNVFTKRAVVIGGPLADADNPELSSLLLEKMVGYLKKKAVYVQFRNIRDVSAINESFIKAGFVFENHLDIVHDLRMDGEEIRKKVSRNKRNNVVKAQNRGAVFSEIASIEEFEAAIGLVFETYRRVGLPCPTKAFFIKAYHALQGVLKTFVVVFEGKPVGVRLELCYKNMVYDWYAGSDDHYKNCYPNDVLPYNILFWAKENKYNTFDFGGAGKPNVEYGVRDHKLKFGGDLVDYGRYERVNSKMIIFFSEKAFALLKKLKSK